MKKLNMKLTGWKWRNCVRCMVRMGSPYELCRDCQQELVLSVSATSTDNPIERRERTKWKS